MPKNNWYVITGGTSSGKTSVSEALAKKGHLVIPEVARSVIDEGVASGKTVDEIRQDELAFQNRILERKIEIEKKHNKNLLTFFDRGMHDTEAYFNHYGWELTQLGKEAMKNSTYRKIFFLDQLPSFKKDYARTESDGFSDKISQLLHEAYKSHGFDIVRVPVMSVKKRVKYILDNLEGKTEEKSEEVS